MRGTQPPREPQPFTIRFDNAGRQHVHVYLIGAKREWLLGRVEPGAKARLRIPGDAMAEDAMFVRLAVLAGEKPTFQAARHKRATLTVAQPASAILSQRWRFSQGELTSMHAEIGRRLSIVGPRGE
jgi:hypothetical protein